MTLVVLRKRKKERKKIVFMVEKVTFKREDKRIKYIFIRILKPRKHFKVSIYTARLNKIRFSYLVV